MDRYKSLKAPLNFDECPKWEHSVEILRSLFFLIQMTDLRVCKVETDQQNVLSSTEGHGEHKYYKREKWRCPRPSLSVFLPPWRRIKGQLLLCSEGDTTFNTLAWTLIPHCLLICTKYLQMDESKGGRGLCGKVITPWCKAGARRGSFHFTFKRKWNSDFRFTFPPPSATAFPSLPPFTRFINVILQIVCIWHVRDLHGWPKFWFSVKVWHGKPDSESRRVLSLT